MNLDPYIIVMAVVAIVCFGAAINILISSRHGKKKGRKHKPVVPEVKPILLKQDEAEKPSVSVVDTLAQLQAFLEHDKKLDG